MHLARHKYTRGANKGDAPALANKRGMNHFRVVKNSNGTMAVRMIHTDIITAYPNGDVRIDTDGWHDHNTTIIRMNEAFDFFEGASLAMYKHRVFSHSQPVLRIGTKRFVYYDGITLNERGEITTELKAFEQKRVDRAETKNLANELQESGFKDAFALLYALATPEDNDDRIPMFGVRLPDALVDNNQADKWKPIIARNKFQRSYTWRNNNRGYEYVERSDAKACWANLMAECKKNMYVVSRSEIYVL